MVGAGPVVLMGSMLCCFCRCRSYSCPHWFVVVLLIFFLAVVPAAGVVVVVVAVVVLVVVVVVVVVVVNATSFCSFLGYGVVLIRVVCPRFLPLHPPGRCD